jgi:hypothetical protein
MNSSELEQHTFICSKIKDRGYLFAFAFPFTFME